MGRLLLWTSAWATALALTEPLLASAPAWAARAVALVMLLALLLVQTGVSLARTCRWSWRSRLSHRRWV